MARASPEGHVERLKQELQPTATAHGLTTKEVAQRFRVSQLKVRGWIRAGKLKAIDTAEPGRKPRFVVLPEALAEFERSRSTAPLPKVPKRKRAGGIDFFPDR